MTPTRAGDRAAGAVLTETVIEDPRWAPAGLSAVAEEAAAAALAELGLPAQGFAIAVLGCDDARIAALNADFRGRPQPTNVLSWPAEERGAAEPGGRPDLPEPGPPDDPEELGDIALAFETCAREAADGGKPLADHLRHLVVHAVLHLCGYDHDDDADAALMEAIEVRALARMGVPDPY